MMKRKKFLLAVKVNNLSFIRGDFYLFLIPVRKRRRIQLQRESIFNQEPNAFEQKLIHNIFLKTMDLNNKSFNVRTIPPGKINK